MVGRTVVTDNAAAIQGNGDRQIGQADIMDELVQGSLHEGGVDGKEGSHALQGQAGGKGDGMLFRDADIEETIREFVTERTAARCRRAWRP